jgi:hypothetical protein
MAGISTDPDVLMNAAQGIAQAVQDLGTKLQDLNATVTTDNPWGADEPGTIFGTLYVGVLGHALESMSSHADKLAYAAEGLVAWAGQLEEAERGVAEHLQRVHQSAAV